MIFRSLLASGWCEIEKNMELIFHDLKVSTKILALHTNQDQGSQHEVKFSTEDVRVRVRVRKVVKNTCITHIKIER